MKMTRRDFLRLSSAAAAACGVTSRANMAMGTSMEERRVVMYA